jgi:tripartite-type tricarboxylate transporter receptor subunit TctC
MKSAIRSLLGGLLIQGALLGLFGAVHAQAPYPSRTITLVVPYAPGGFIDVATRVLATGLQNKLGQTVIVVNKAGGNGKVALGELIRGQPDGYTFLTNNDGGISIPPAADPQFTFNYALDYVGVSQIVIGRYAVIVRSGLPVSSMKELVEYARANPGKLTYASPGLGTIAQFAMELLQRQTNISSLLHVPYSGAANALRGILTGEVDILVTAVSSLVSFNANDKFKILSVLADERDPTFPDVPTLAEAGFTPIPIGGWIGVFAPSGVPAPILARFSDAVREVLNDPPIIEHFKLIGAQVAFKDANTFAGYYRSEVGKWKDLVERYKIKLYN